MSLSSRVPAHSFDHPAFSVLESSVRARVLSLDHFPEPHELLGLARGLKGAIPPWFEFARQDGAELAAAGSFDRLLARTNAIPTRHHSFHDLLGALSWLPIRQYAARERMPRLTSMNRACWC
jgi:hypothetical protein